MEQVKLTKTELRLQQIKLAQLQKYLPTLQLKKALLQLEVNQAVVDLTSLQAVLEEKEAAVLQMSPLFSDRGSSSFFQGVVVRDVRIRQENIAGVEIPIFEGVDFPNTTYSLFDTPAWYEAGTEKVRSFLASQEEKKVLDAKKRALEKELREVSIRVNLFEKIMIPRAMENIKKIKIFLGDQQLAAVAQAKVAKHKMEERARTS